MTWVTGAFYTDACFWIPFFFFIAFAGYLLYNKDKSDEKRGSKLCRLYPLAAMAFVFAGNILLAIIIVALDIFLEIKLYRCPHCGKGLDCRRRVNEDTVCPKCQKYIFRGL